MVSSNENIELTIQLNYQEDFDKERLSDDSYNLADELQTFPIDDVKIVREGKVPDKAKSGIDPIVLGGILVYTSQTVLPKILEFVYAWAMRREGRNIKIKIQNQNGSIEIDVPETKDIEDIKLWINELTKKLSEDKRKK